LIFVLQLWKTIHTESSYKFTYETIRILLHDAGFVVAQSSADRREWYSVTIARPLNAYGKTAIATKDRQCWIFVRSSSAVAWSDGLASKRHLAKAQQVI
jgi:hypothetical protein